MSAEDETSPDGKNVHFITQGAEPLGLLSDPVNLPQISKIGALASRHASVAKNQESKQMRATGMKAYSTFIRQVNEFHISKRVLKKANYPIKNPEPTHYQKYRKYMSMIEEDDGSFPRVSELSLRIEHE